MAQPEDEKVKVVYFNDPKKFKFVTKQAAAYLSPKWILAEDQSGTPNPNGQKKAVAAPAASTIDRKAELREKYNELTGEEAEPEWNEARLFTEIEKATIKAAKQAAEPKIEAPAETSIEEPQVSEAATTETPKRKYNKKAKTEAVA